jgi:hypothetical protein
MKDPHSPSEEKTKPYKVFVDDNFHFMDEDERYLLGTFETMEEAESVARRNVDDFLTSAGTSGMTAGGLYACYTMFGEDPFIVGPDSSVSRVDPETGEMESFPRFSAWEYAEQRCQEICGKASENTPPSVDIEKGTS